MKPFLLVFAAAGCVYGAGQAASLTNTTASATVPAGTVPAAALTASAGSYWVDFRVTSWSLPASGCDVVMQIPLATNNPFQIRVCAPGTGFEPFTIYGGSDRIVDGNPLRMGPPSIAIRSTTATNPATLTLASAPYPSSMSAGQTITIWGSSCAGMNGNWTVTAVSGNTIAIGYDATGCTSYTANSGSVFGQDFVFRLHRDGVLNQDIAESWNVDGSGYTSLSYSLTSASAIAYPAHFVIGPAHTTFAFVRWYAGTIPVNGAAPWGASVNAGGTPLADWEFNGSGADSSGNTLDLNFTQTPAYSERPTYPPGCNAGVPQTVRAGTTLMLDGSRSFPLDGGGSLSYLWQQIASDQPGTLAQSVLWHSHKGAVAAVSGFVAGPLNFQLTVTDQSGGSSVCTVHDGAVATDDNGNIAIADPKVAEILGPMLEWGSPNAPWPFLDSNEKQWADLLGPLQGQADPGKAVPDFRDLWNVALTGTVETTNGAYRVYGTGTSFKTDFCAGGKFPPTPGYYNLIVWYPNPAIAGGYGRRRVIVGKCVSDTIIDIQAPWSDDDGTSPTAYTIDAPASFSYMAGQTLIWRPAVSCAGGPTTVDVNGLGAVALKRSDGVTDPWPADCPHQSDLHRGINLTYDGSVMRIMGPYIQDSSYAWSATAGDTSGMQYAAWNNTDFTSWNDNGSTDINYYDNVAAFYSLYYRTGIDTYLRYARWLADKWWTMPSYDSGFGSGMIPRQAAFTGLILRAIDQDDTAGAAGASPMWPGLRRITDSVFRPIVNGFSSNGELLGDIRETSYNNMWVAMCAAYDPDATHAAACRADLNQSILKTWKPQRQPEGFWQMVIADAGSVPNTWVIVPTVAGTVTVTPGSTAVTITGGTWTSSLFPTHFVSVSNPFDLSTLDSGYYNATYVDATHIQLDRPYSDVCGSMCAGRQWFIGKNWVGFGVQPFMLGIAGQFFNQSSIGLGRDSQYGDTAALAKSYVVDVANWLVNHAVEPGTRGLWYGVGFGVCNGLAPINPSCDGGGNSGGGIAQGRELNPEVLGTMAIAYTYSPTPALRSGIDDLFSAMYAKYPTDPGYDGIYGSDMDNWNLFTDNSKWFGFCWGMGRDAAWPSARQGGLAAPQPATMLVAGDPALFARAAQVQVIVTDTTGAVEPPVPCQALPCAVTVDRSRGNPLVQMVYLAANGMPLSVGNRLPAPVR